MLDIKDGVDLGILSPQALLAIVVADAACKHYGETLTITSVRDGKHMVASLHYTGEAFDFRLPRRENILFVATALRRSLGKLYDVVIERDHIHVEYDPPGRR